MFHRIKSETQTQDQQKSTQPVQNEQSVADESAAVEQVEENIQVTESTQAAEAPVETPIASSEQETAQDQTESSQHSTPDNENEKDNSPMTSSDTVNETSPQQDVQDMPAPEQAYRAPVSGGYAYGSNYTAPAPAQEEQVSAPATTTVASAASDNRQLVIGQGITMSGEIEACDDLVVEGTVEASLKGARVLSIAETGTFYGTVEIADATISGRFEGDITVTGRLVISETGRITGSITYGEIEMKAGASIDGKLTPLKAVGMSSAKPNVKSAAKVAPNTQVQDPANTQDGQLFANGTAE